jgi:Effector-associated domain 4
MSRKYTYGEDNRERTRRVLEVLLTYGNEFIPHGKIKCLRTDKGFNFEISRADLTTLIQSRYTSDWEHDIYPVISHYLGWLEILQDNRTERGGSSMWKFSLNPWCDNTAENMRQFNDEWMKKCPDRQKKAFSEDLQQKKQQSESSNNPQGSIDESPISVWAEEELSREFIKMIRAKRLLFPNPKDFKDLFERCEKLPPNLPVEAIVKEVLLILYPGIEIPNLRSNSTDIPTQDDRDIDLELAHQIAARIIEFISK